MQTTRPVLIGFFFLLTLSVLGYYTLFLTDFSLFGKQAELVVHFSETNGLREGDSVLVAGLRWGRVSHMSFDPTAPRDRRITVTAKLNEELVLREGFVIQIEDATLLGGRILSIDPGPADAQPIDLATTVLYGTVAPNPLDALGDLVKSSEKGVRDVFEDLSTLTRSVREGKGVVGRVFTDEQMAEDLAQSVSDASKTLANLQTISTDLVQAKGTAGKLLSDATLYDDLASASQKLTATLDEAQGLLSDMRRGDGVVGRLVSDPRMAEDLAKSVADLRTLTEKVAAGQGTIGKLLLDDAIAHDIQTITGRIAAGEGTLGALVSRPEVYEDLRATTENLAAISSALRNSQGTVGKLINDPEVYQQIKTAMQIVQRTLEEFREAAPVTTFTSVFFGAF